MRAASLTLTSPGYVKHGKAFAEGLHGLQKYTSPIELATGECLFSCDGGIIEEHQRGLFFIEEGIMVRPAMHRAAIWVITLFTLFLCRITLFRKSRETHQLL